MTQEQILTSYLANFVNVRESLQYKNVRGFGFIEKIFCYGEK